MGLFALVVVVTADHIVKNIGIYQARGEDL